MSYNCSNIASKPRTTLLKGGGRGAYDDLIQVLDEALFFGVRCLSMADGHNFSLQSQVFCKYTSQPYLAGLGGNWPSFTVGDIHAQLCLYP